MPKKPLEPLISLDDLKKVVAKLIAVRKSEGSDQRVRGKEPPNPS